MSSLLRLERHQFESNLSIRPSEGAREEEILDGGGGRRESSLPFSLPSFPFPPETPDTQANSNRIPALTVTDGHVGFKCTAVSSVFYLFIDDKKTIF